MHLASADMTVSPLSAILEKTFVPQVVQIDVVPPLVAKHFKFLQEQSLCRMVVMSLHAMIILDGECYLAESAPMLMRLMDFLAGDGELEPDRFESIRVFARHMVQYVKHFRSPAEAVQKEPLLHQAVVYAIKPLEKDI